MRLFELTQEHRQLRDLIDAELEQTGGEITEEIDTLLSTLDLCAEDKSAKLNSIAGIIAEMKAEHESVKAVADSIAAKAKTISNRIESLRKYVLECGDSGEKVKTPLFSISWGVSKALACADGDYAQQLPDELKTVTVAPKKTEIKKRIEAGESFHGFAIVENKTVTIR